MIPTGKRLVIGLGTGRCGTSSLRSLVEHQPGALCFHELRAREMAWTGAEKQVELTVRELEEVLLTGSAEGVYVEPRNASKRETSDRSIARVLQEGRVDVVGDIGFYYLNYVGFIQEIARVPVTFVCMQRGREEVVGSYLKKMRTARGTRNHWVEHPNARWIPDAIWDKCYPTYSERSLEGAIGRYYDHYAEATDEMNERYGSFSVFDVDLLNSEHGRERILKHAGFDVTRIRHPRMPPHENSSR